MNWFLYHIASGSAFFSGAAILLIAPMLERRDKPLTRSLASIACMFGIALIVVSSTPLPKWYYIFLGVLAFGWFLLPSEKPPKRTRAQRLRRFAKSLLPFAVLIGVVWEVPYRLTPRIERETSPTLIIFGDSVTAGVGANEAATWPNLLRQNHDVTIHDHARAGATVSTTLSTAQKLQLPSGLIVLEIGGNDVLSSAPVDKFREDLDKLLALLTAAKRQVVMLELPLPPFHHEYGRVQRQLAATYRVKLIPKHIFMRVLSTNGATLDSIHLSQTGHDAMAREMWRILGPAFSG